MIYFHLLFGKMLVGLEFLAAIQSTYLSTAVVVNVMSSQGPPIASFSLIIACFSTVTFFMVPVFAQLILASREHSFAFCLVFRLF